MQDPVFCDTIHLAGIRCGITDRKQVTGRKEMFLGVLQSTQTLDRQSSVFLIVFMESIHLPSRIIRLDHCDETFRVDEDGVTAQVKAYSSSDVWRNASTVPKFRLFSGKKKEKRKTPGLTKSKIGRMPEPEGFGRE